MSEVRFRDSIFARLIAWAIVVSVAATLLLWGVTVTTLDRASRVAMMRAVDVDLAGLADIHASGGQGEIEKRIADRVMLSGQDSNAAHYMVSDNGGHRLAGDVQGWPITLSARLSDAGYITLSDGTPVYARVTQLGPNLRLLVAREYRHDSALRSAIGWAFLAAGALVVAVVGVMGRNRARILAGRIGRINRAFRAQDEASLAALAEDGAARDEIGELTRHSADALARLRRMVAAQRDTTDNVAHELRTPLMHLDNRLVKALGSATGDADRRLLADARGEIRQIIALLESLLDIATSEARRGDRHGLNPVNLSQLVSRIGELYADSADEGGYRFVRSIMPGIIVQGEEMQLMRLVTNLLDNAFKYVPAGCTVRLALEKGPRLTVADDGPGVAEADRPHIFDRFRRGARAGHAPAGVGMADAGGVEFGAASAGIGSVGVASVGVASVGAGLGLALARAIAERHGLTLQLCPSDEGACFVVAPESLS